jgi:TniQ
MTRVAQYHGWTADEFLALLGQDTTPWEGYFRQIDVDCAPSQRLLDSLAEITGYSRDELALHGIAPSASALWLDDRVAFCENCWAQPDAIPYVRRAWLDAWCIECPVHQCALVTIAKVHRARKGADWNAAWNSRYDWSQRANALWTPNTSELLGRGSVVIVRPPRVNASQLSEEIAEREGDCDEVLNLLNILRRRYIPAKKGKQGTADNRSAHSAAALEGALAVNSSQATLEKRLVLLAGRSWEDFSIVRAFFDLHERIAWRNTAEGFDPDHPLTEPVGSLTIRSGAIRIGRALTDILFDQPYREPRIANPLRRWIGGLYGKPRVHLLR